uniref:Mimecan n=1 Tax=Periophthalmus magnuspinnatus TaxID=409849 RepID=A0A3B4AML3_9GOBI
MQLCCEGHRSLLRECWRVNHKVKLKEDTKQVREKVVVKFKAGLGSKKISQVLEHLKEHCSIHHPEMESMAQLQTFSDIAVHQNLQNKPEEPGLRPGLRSGLSPGLTPSDLPTCLLCVCLTGSVYCEEVNPDMTTVPALPRETAYLYARFNKIKKIGTKDFADMLTLKRIDLTGNLISEIEDGAFSKLSLLEELSLAENRLVKLPMLPAKLTTFNANFNMLKTKGVKANAFKKLTKLSNLYLSDNQLEAVPHIPESVRTLHLQNNNITEVSVDTFCRSNDTYYLRPRLTEIRLDGNPVLLSKNPDTFTCLNVLPVGRYR